MSFARVVADALLVDPGGEVGVAMQRAASILGRSPRKSVSQVSTQACAA
jgi:hypothetical protein